LPLASFSLTSVKELHVAPFPKKNDAASPVIIHSSRNPMGQVIRFASLILHKMAKYLSEWL
jgi:hypothetical protein